MLQRLFDFLSWAWEHPIAAVLYALLALAVAAAFLRLLGLLHKYLHTKWFLWRRGMPKELLGDYNAILGYEELLKLLVPINKFIAPRDTEGGFWAWLYRRVFSARAWAYAYGPAIKATLEENSSKNTGENVYLARERIRAAMKRIRVRPLNEEEQNTLVLFNPDEPYEHFVLELTIPGLVFSTVEKAIEGLKTLIGIVEEKPPTVPQPNPQCVAFLCSKAERKDPLMARPRTSAWLDEHPMTQYYPPLLPLAYTPDEKVWSLYLMHTLILGTTGAGKGSAQNSIVYQLAPWVDKGYFRLWGIDPKQADLYALSESRLFHRLATGHRQEDIAAAIELIAEYTAAMNEEIEARTPESEDTKPSKKTPWNILIIDEFVTLYRKLEGYRDKEAGRQARDNLQAILQMGRALGYVVILTSQSAEKKDLESRDNIQNVICLRLGKLATDHFNDLALGEGAAQAGYDARKISATKDKKANAQGVAYVLQQEDGEILRVRFPYISPENKRELVKMYPRKGGQSTGGNTGKSNPLSILDTVGETMEDADHEEAFMEGDSLPDIE